MSHYKKLVLEKSGAILDTELKSEKKEYDVSFDTIQTADGHEIYAAIDRAYWTNIIPDRDIYLEAAYLQSEIESAINLGSTIYVDEYILNACELDDDSDRWEHLWNEWHGEMKSFNF